MDEDIPKVLAGTVLWVVAVAAVMGGTALACGLAFRVFWWAAGF
jgi:uncharacterized membrane protein YphA (DoxX/SURF4 family)